MLRPILARALPFALVITLCTVDGGAQTRETKNPVEGQPKAIEQGDFVYKRRCSSCHGLDARGIALQRLLTVCTRDIVPRVFGLGRASSGRLPRSGRCTPAGRGRGRAWARRARPGLGRR